MGETQPKGRSEQEQERAGHRLLALIRELLLELNPRQARRLRLTLDSRLDRDLGFDSLSRVELLLRVNSSYRIELSESVFTEAETPRDLLEAIAESAPASVAAVPRTAEEEALEAAQAFPDHAETLNEVLRWHAETHGERPHVYLYGDEPDPTTITYGELYREACSVAAALQRFGVRPGQNIAIMLPTSREYLQAFFAVLLAGGVPVPIYPPARMSQIEDHLRRHARLLDNAEAVLLITVPEARTVARLLQAQVPSLAHIVTPAELEAPADELIQHERSGDDTAFLQYTSGSTGDPKGVVLSHAHLLANIRTMGDALDVREEDRFVSWLPLYHDMGLIGAWLGTQYYAMPLVLMSPLAFLTNPSRWLRAIHRHRGTISAAPNFAYELCLKRIDDGEIDELDLSSWRIAANGAEPVSPHTIRGFAERFARAGLRRSAIFPVYGLAEAAVGLAFPPLERGPAIDRIERDPFLTEGRAVPASDEVAEALEFVGCGRPLPGYQIRVVDERGRELPDRQQGRVEFQGPSATSGYFRRPDATGELFDGEWLHTGDLGYLAGGELYLTGRAKDVIIRGGRNLHPQEIEYDIGQIDGIRAGCVAAFGSRDPQSGNERLIVVAETRERDGEKREELERRINAVTSDVLGMPPDEVVLAPPQTVLKTSSGKIRRSAVRDIFESGRIGVATASPYWQFTRLFASSVAAQGRQLRIRARRLAYAGYVQLWFWLLAPIGWLLGVITPVRRWRWRVVRRVARSLLWLCRIPLEVEGVDNVPRSGRYIVVANHASYLDGVVLMAALPEMVSFVAKAELKNQLVAGLFLRRLGTVFVERFDHEAGAADAQHAAERIDEAPLVYFPEGTLTREPGLMPFRMGAFMAATRAGVPVVPVAIDGTRSVLRGDTWFPYRYPIRVSIRVPVQPYGDSWNAAIGLRDRARGAILEYLDEPDLAAR